MGMVFIWPNLIKNLPTYPKNSFNIFKCLFRLLIKLAFYYKAWIIIKILGGTISLIDYSLKCPTIFIHLDFIRNMGRNAEA